MHYQQHVIRMMRNYIWQRLLKLYDVTFLIKKVFHWRICKWLSRRFCSRIIVGISADDHRWSKYCQPIKFAPTNLQFYQFPSCWYSLCTVKHGRPSSKAVGKSKLSIDGKLRSCTKSDLLAWIS